MKKLLLVTQFILSAAIVMNAQSISIENVHKVTLRSFDAIKEGSEVKGYYFFYISDKIDKKTNEYTLQITDNNLTKLKDIKFQDSKNVTVLESSFNGTDIVFMFYNDDSKTLEYQVYGADGKKKYSYFRELSKRDVEYMAIYFKAQAENEDYVLLQPIEGKGFISNMPSREENDYTFQLDFYSTEKRKQWSYLPTGAAKSFSGTFLGYSNNIVYFTLVKAKAGLLKMLVGGMSSIELDISIVGLNIETGKQVFERPVDRLKNQLLPTNMSEINGKTYINGLYLSQTSNIFKDDPLGFGFIEMDSKGTVLSEKYCSWNTDLNKVLDVNSKGKIDNFGYLFMHNMISTQNNEIYIIGEGFMKAGSVLSSKAKVTDIMMIKFDQDLNVKSATIYGKNSNTASVQGGTSAFLMGGLLKLGGNFDYVYSQVNKDRSSFSVCYSDYIKDKTYKGITFNSINYNDGQITTDKINTKSDASKSYILPGKQGQVLILDYYKKDKKLSAHLEKLN